MKHKKEKREAWPAAAGVLALALAVWAALGFVTGAWISFGKKAVALQNSQFQVEAEFAGLETISGDGLAWDSLNLTLECQEGRSIGFYEERVLAEYWFLGRWYELQEQKHTYSVDDEPEERQFRFPAGLFGKRGLYRVRLVKTDLETRDPMEAGRCEFWVINPTQSVEGAGNNDFDHWYRLGDHEDYLDEHMSLSFKSIYCDQNARTQVVFGLISDRSYYTCNAERRVDMLWQGEWYTVWSMGAVPAYAGHGICVPGEEIVMTEEIPGQVLGHKGRYRLYWGGAAYCEFEIE